MKTACVVVVLALAAALAAGSAVPAPGPAAPAFPAAVDGAFLQDALAAGGVQVVDARPTLAFLEAHVPGARLLVPDNLRSMHRGVTGELHEPALIAAIAARAGLAASAPVVVVGEGADLDAPYVATALRLAGFARVAVLDGGVARWLAERRPVTKDRPAIPAADAAGAAASPPASVRGVIATLDDVRRAVEAKDAVLVDARPADQYRRGHIPGAVSRPWALDYAGGRWRGAEELAAAYAALGAGPGAPVIVYCNSGHMASSVYYTLRHVLGRPDVRLYDGSMLEWTAQQPALPVEAAPELVRARDAAQALSADLMGRLGKELAAGGPARAVSVCAEVAPQVARERSTAGLTVRRVSARPRNPADAPDAFEAERLTKMETAHATGLPAGELAEWQPDGTLRMMRPIVVGKACLACHGDAAQIDPDVRRLLAARYPDDKATGYREGDFRGAVSVMVAPAAVEPGRGTAPPPRAAATAAKGADVLAHTVQSLEGKDVDLAAFRGKAVLIVNTASECGYTPQYKGLQELYDKYKGRGLVVLGFPSNDFGGQEPGAAGEIAQFCRKNYGVTFPMMAKVHAKGPEIAPLYRTLTQETSEGIKGEVKWNFTKFLVDPQGRVVKRFEPKVEPLSAELTAAVESVLP